MAENRKISPKGIDIPIDRLQHLIYLGLQSNGWTNHESYHRAYKNDTDNGQTPEFALGVKDYKEVLFDDNFYATSFFLVEDTFNRDELYDTTVSIIFQVNLQKLFPSITTHRADEEMHRLIALILEDNKWDYKLNRIVTSLNDVYAGLDSFDLSQVKTDDMSDFHVVRFDIDINFNYYCDSNYSPATCRVATILDSNGIDYFTVASGGSGTCTPALSASGFAYSRPAWNGQDVSYALYDAKWQFDNGQFQYTPPTNPATVASLASFLVLGENNQFGNTNRFTDVNGLQVFPNDYRIDHYTGLGWTDISRGSFDFATSLSNANSSTLFGYTDWRLPTMAELTSIICRDLSLLTGTSTAAFNYGGIFNTTHTALSSCEIASHSTSNRLTTSSGFLVAMGGVTANRQHIYVREHYT
jgi:hypothetical protein